MDVTFPMTLFVVPACTFFCSIHAWLPSLNLNKLSPGYCLWYPNLRTHSQKSGDKEINFYIIIWIFRSKGFNLHYWRNGIGTSKMPWPIKGLADKSYTLSLISRINMVGLYWLQWLFLWPPDAHCDTRMPPPLTHTHIQISHGILKIITVLFKW